jgi:hypothetical protein
MAGEREAAGGIGDYRGLKAVKAASSLSFGP